MKQTEDWAGQVAASLSGPSRETGTWLEDPRVLRAVEEYLAAQQAGNQLDREAFLAQHANIAGPLAECLEGLEFIQAAAPQLNQSADPSANPTSAEVQPEAPLGDYRIVREVG